MLDQRTKRHTLLATGLVSVLSIASAFAADGDKSSVKGLIVSVQGDTIVIKDANNTEQTFMVTPETTVKKRQGLTGVITEKVQQGALMPGLPITADLVEKGGQRRAEAISFRSEDFRTAQQVQAGVAPTSERVDTMGKRMDDFGTYEQVAGAEVMFASGSTTISAQGKSDLMALAGKAKEIDKYAVVLQGFTDSTGDAAANQRLSTRRAAAVANFLQQQGGLAPGRVTSADGMGIAADAGSGDNANARKVVVKLVVDKGVSGAK
jgi:OmpA-OmpF porin, OOP family